MTTVTGWSLYITVTQLYNTEKNIEGFRIDIIIA